MAQLKGLPLHVELYPGFLSPARSLHRTTWELCCPPPRVLTTGDYVSLLSNSTTRSLVIVRTGKLGELRERSTDWVAFDLVSDGPSSEDVQGDAICVQHDYAHCSQTDDLKVQHDRGCPQFDLNSKTILLARPATASDSPPCHHIEELFEQHPPPALPVYAQYPPEAEEDFAQLMIYAAITDTTVL
ncbi:hypothetical protein BC834DRAFT_968691 [Gloeopeniophorella convolvens]|nr:hypothetical protein BC834DRAFT_968691 [Gloeopeniophorella convolvens]